MSEVGGVAGACADMRLATRLAGCGGGSGMAAGATAPASTLSAAAQTLEALFRDNSLSASGQQSCVNCDLPARAFTADPATDHGLPVPLGGAHRDLPAFRNAASLMYASFTPPFFMDDGTPAGGFFRDGRASSLEARRSSRSSRRSTWPNANAHPATDTMPAQCQPGAP